MYHTDGQNAGRTVKEVKKCRLGKNKRKLVMQGTRDGRSKQAHLMRINVVEYKEVKKRSAKKCRIM